MRRYLLALCALLIASLATAAPALGATTPNFAFKHGETNVQTGPTYSAAGARPPCTNGAPCPYEIHEFEIKPGEENGAFKVTTTWGGNGTNGDTQDDWDLYVYRVLEDGTEEEVASSATGGTTEETATLQSSPEGPIEPGKFRIYMDNFKVEPRNQEWEGFTSFEPFALTNQLPVGALTAPGTATAGQPVTLDASSSRDPDGSIVNYAWDLDSDGRFEVGGGASPTLTRSFDAGRRNVGVRVRDNRGGLGYANRTIVVGPAPAVTVAPPASELALPQPVRRTALDVRARQKRTTVLRRGLAATAECPRACRISAQLRVPARTARRLGIPGRSIVLARQTRTLRDRGFARLRLKPSGRVTRSRVRRLSSVRGTVRVTISPVGERSRTFSRSVTIVR